MSDNVFENGIELTDVVDDVFNEKGEHVAVDGHFESIASHPLEDGPNGTGVEQHPHKRHHTHHSYQHLGPHRDAL